ncbi:hypothetical protein M8J75_004118 [Diaphorina citri]|nr:hypothetical protein M8J75_004118 [Diaphorina citri]
MSDSEEDYMSMDFSSVPTQDIRPGLLQTSRQKRELALLKRKQEADGQFREKNKKRNLKLVEEEHREEGLRKPIDEGNKGFALLAKMGYTPGSGIGRTEEKLRAPTALIDIRVKTSRAGLGGLEPRSRQAKPRPAGRTFPPRDDLTSDRLAEFRRGLASRLGEKKVLADLGRSQRVCVEFDRRAGLTEPKRWWYWPPGEIEDDLGDDLDFRDDLDFEDEGQSEPERIDVLQGKNAPDCDENEKGSMSTEQGKGAVSDTSREKNTPASGVGVKNINTAFDENKKGSIATENSKTDCDGSARNPIAVEDSELSCDNQKELRTKIPKTENSNAPTDSEEGKKSTNDAKNTTASSTKDGINANAEEKLASLNSYLRSAHCYCIWCGTQYEDSEDMGLNCPGTESDDH